MDSYELYKVIESFFSNSEFVFEFLAENRIFSKESRGVNIDQIALCCITCLSMDSSQRAIQTDVNVFFIFPNLFQISYNLKKKKNKNNCCV